MNKNYFKWLIKSRRISILFFLLISVAFQLIPITGYDPQRPDETFITCASVGNVLSVLLSAAVPVLLFSYIHRKSSVDMFLSLPVSRKEQLLTNILFTWLMAYGSFFLGTTIVWVTKTFQAIPLRAWAFLQLYEAYSLLVLILVNTAIFVLANSIFDGIIMIGAYSVLPGIVGISVLIFMESMIAGRNLPPRSFVSDIAVMLSPAGMLSANLECILYPDYIQFTGFSRTYVILQFLYGMIATALLRHHFIKRKAERAGQISDDILSYPFIINIYLILILLDMAWTVVSGDWDGMGFFYLLLFFIYIVASFVYKRSLRITWRPIAFFAFAAVASLCFAKAGWVTEGFGLSKLPFELFNERYLCYSYDAYVSLDDLGTMLKSGENIDRHEAKVEFTVTIPEEEKDRYGVIIEKLEDYRRQSISRFYSKDYTDHSGYVTFRIYNKRNIDEGREYEQYDYDGAYPLSEDELREISRFCEVTVRPYLDSDARVSSEDMSLSEFFRWRASEYKPAS